ncbi:MAG: hypothetical protein HWE16_03560 [Gammaproteobacteria bacterium]|nr:hypothetical protein [Gammaproteobacteria bacterium]
MKPYLIAILALLSAPSAFAEKTLQECIDTENDLERLVCYDSIFGHSKGKGSPNLGSTNSNQDNFGAERIKKDDPTANMMETKIVGEFDYLEKGDKINLSNGQVWVVTESRTFRYKAKNPEVIISKGFLGSYFLEFPGHNRRIKVKRVK